ncbi:hypothetical protein Runsl_2056 [Runella slithyformis DSM 19594]|uniref:Uncharacterized protein n=1 Tax=Runella slithyformis (strain ATCC 29530 / DSM 19594 / LMG 11500 / NCIMB 11436 / LSU 4) TaxID=761193 RepID=A0A7U3ZJU1_RUNSL|nr:hypothetical protein Runsl_2056 [Runella slithyformis DSM 19594]
MRYLNNYKAFMTTKNNFNYLTSMPFVFSSIGMWVGTYVFISFLQSNLWISSLGLLAVCFGLFPKVNKIITLAKSSRRIKHFIIGFIVVHTIAVIAIIYFIL